MCLPCASRHAIRVGEQYKAGAKATGQSGRGFIGVDVDNLAVLIERERRDDGQLAGRQQRIQHRGPCSRDAPDPTKLWDTFGDQQAAIDAGQADRRSADAQKVGDQVPVHEAAENGQRDLQGGVVCHAAPILEA